MALVPLRQPHLRRLRPRRRGSRAPREQGGRRQPLRRLGNRHRDPGTGRDRLRVHPSRARMGRDRHRRLPRTRHRPADRLRAHRTQGRPAVAAPARHPASCARRRDPDPGRQWRRDDRGHPLLAFYFQIVLGMGPLMAGLANLAMTVAIMAFSPVTTKILNTFGPRPLMIVGPLVSAAGLFLLLGITPDGNYFLQVLPALVVLGIGLSMLFVPVQNLALLGVENEDAGVASAVVNSVFHIGGSIGLAVFTVFYASTADSAIASGTAELTAFTDGYKAVFLAAAVTMVAASLTGFLLIRGKKEDLNPAWDEAEAALVH
ncbi:hypothetical protein C5C99_05155 [Rathayibacter sp. AY1C4]|nr:hypothetical protein C5C99_05155 [Rathayibacter sp. AY1C4]